MEMGRHTPHTLPALALAVMIFCLPAAASEPEYMTYEKPPPETALDVGGAFKQEVEPVDTAADRKRRRDVYVTGVKKFLREDASLLLRPRSYYLERRRDGLPNSEAWALGGALEYSTGKLRDRFRLGTALYSSQKLYGPRNRDGTLLLKRRQQSFTVLGEAFLEIGITKTLDLSLYRQKLNLPYVNKQDNRMVPNTFEAYMITNKESPRFNYTAGHITRMKLRNQTSFIHMSEAAGADDSNKGLSFLGALYTPSSRFSIGAIDYQSWDVMNTFYTEANFNHKLDDHFALHLGGQYTRQKSSGDELIGDFDTGVFGTKLDISYKNTILSMAYTSTDSDSRIFSPYGGYPGYISLIIEDFNRAGEDAWLLGLSYNFARLGIKGLTAFMNFASGDTPDRGSNASPDLKEYDFTVDYVFGKQALKGFWVRARYAHVDEDGPDAIDLDDYRVILNYSIPLH